MRPEEASRIIKRPYVTEKTFDMIERQNKLVFVVSRSASKSSVKRAIESLYAVKVEAVNTVNTLVGKKAYVRLSKESSAADLASKLGLV